LKKKVVREDRELYGADPAFRHLLAQTSPSDFDGHTDFHLLTLEQRLEWLSLVVQFTWMVKQARRRR
jgi:hypothetical protein